MTVVVNASIIHQQLKKKKASLLDFMIPLAEQLTNDEKKLAKHKETAMVNYPNDWELS